MMVNDRSDGSWIPIPHDLLFDPTAGVDGLVDVIYPNISLLHDDLSYFRTRAILAPRNDEVDFLNNLLLQRIQSEEQVYYSCDSALPLDESITHDPSLCTLEYLHSLNFNGVPPHILYLKVGAPVILLRNLDQSVGLCNGTRLLIRVLHEKVIDAKIMTGSCAGHRVYIPRIVFMVSKTDACFSLRRRQFPVKLAWQ